MTDDPAPNISNRALFVLCIIAFAAVLFVLLRPIETTQTEPLTFTSITGAAPTRTGIIELPDGTRCVWAESPNGAGLSCPPTANQSRGTAPALKQTEPQTANHNTQP